MDRKVLFMGMLKCYTQPKKKTSHTNSWDADMFAIYSTDCIVQTTKNTGCKHSVTMFV